MKLPYNHLSTLFLVLLLVCTVGAVAGSETREISARDAYGSSSLVVGNEILVGETSGFSMPGQVHVLRRDPRGSWDVVQTITASDASIGDGFGTVLVEKEGVLAISAPGAGDNRGGVYLFEKNGADMWEQVALIAGSGDRFGSSMTLTDGQLFVGMPQDQEGVGSVLVYAASQDWSLTTTLQADQAGDRLLMGASLASTDGMVMVGLPGHDSGRGRVDVYSTGQGHGFLTSLTSPNAQEGDRLGANLSFVAGRLFDANPRAGEGHGIVRAYEPADEGRTWNLVQELMPESEGDDPLFFGTAIAASMDEIWISAPLADDFKGLVYRYDTNNLSRLGTIGNEGISGRSQFGTSMALGTAFAVVGTPGADYGLGSAIVFEQRADGEWAQLSMYNGPGAQLPAVTGGEIECEGGESNGNPCMDVDLVSFVPLADLKMNRGVRLNDVWGWTDPETGKEYGIIGHMEGSVFLDLSDPTHPVVLGELPRTEGSPGSTWRDMKVYRDHAFIVADGAGEHGMQVFDLTRLRSWPGTFQTYEPDHLYTGIASSHNIVINENTGYAYTVGNSSGGETCGGGLHMINIQTPLEPTFMGCFNDPMTGNGGSGATHDAQCVTYAGPDDAHRGKEICVGSNGTAISIADVTDKANPVAISQGTYPNSAYVHQGWFSDDHRYFYQNDEADETSGVVDRTRTMIWDLSDLDEPEMIAEYYGDTNSTDHNLYVKGDFMYQTNNASGLRVIDISDRTNPVEVGYFDTTPNNRNVAGFDGTWSSYPYFESGVILLTSRREGLFLVRKKQVDI